MNSLKNLFRISFWLAQLFAATAYAQLVVAVSSPNIGGQKAIIKLTMKNTFANKIESARAVVFLLDDQGTMIGQGTRWIIGGAKERPALAAGKEVTYNFVVQGAKPFATTNLTARVSFTQVTLEGGQQIDPSKNVTLNVTKKD